MHVAQLIKDQEQPAGDTKNEHGHSKRQLSPPMLLLAPSMKITQRQPVLMLPHSLVEEIHDSGRHYLLTHVCEPYYVLQQAQGSKCASYCGKDHLLTRRVCKPPLLLSFHMLPTFAGSLYTLAYPCGLYH